MPPPTCVFNMSAKMSVRGELEEEEGVRREGRVARRGGRGDGRDRLELQRHCFRWVLVLAGL